MCLFGWQEDSQPELPVASSLPTAMNLDAGRLDLAAATPTEDDPFTTLTVGARYPSLSAVS